MTTILTLDDAELDELESQERCCVITSSIDTKQPDGDRTLEADDFMWLLFDDIYFTASIPQSPDGEVTEDVAERRQLNPIIVDPRRPMVFLKPSQTLCPLAYMNEDILQSH